MFEYIIYRLSSAITSFYEREILIDFVKTYKNLFSETELNQIFSNGK